MKLASHLLLLLMLMSGTMPLLALYVVMAQTETDTASPCAFYISFNKDTACNNMHFNDLHLQICVSKYAN
jgi:hypothetical protein